MEPLSAMEALGPAWRHTRDLLGRQRLGTLLKICFIAVLAEMGGFNAGTSGTGRSAGLGGGMGAVVFVALFFLAVLGLVVWACFFYLASRMQFVLFDIVLLRDDRVAPSWERHRAHTLRWIAAKVASVVVLAIVLAPLVILLVLRVVQFLHVTQTHAAAKPAFSLFLSFFLQFGASILLFSTVVAGTIFFVHDFVMPSIALEDAGIREAYSRGFRLLRAEPGQVCAFLGMRFATLFLGSLVAYVPLAILIMLVMGLGISLAHIFQTWVLGVVTGIVVCGLMCLVGLVLAGALLVFQQAYAIYFLAGRYAYLAQLLAASASGPGTPAAPAVAPPEGGGPAFPLDPASAEGC